MYILTPCDNSTINHSSSILQLLLERYRRFWFFYRSVMQFERDSRHILARTLLSVFGLGWVGLLNKFYLNTYYQLLTFQNWVRTETLAMNYYMYLQLKGAVNNRSKEQFSNSCVKTPEQFYILHYVYILLEWKSR